MQNITNTTTEHPRYTTQPTPTVTTSVGRKNIPFIRASSDSSDDEDYSPTPIERQQKYERQQLALQRQLEMHKQQQQQQQHQPQQPPTPPPHSHYAMVEPGALQGLTQSHGLGRTFQSQQTGPLRRSRLPQHSRSTSISIDMDSSLLSELSRQFIRKIKALENVRELFCANEYPASFTGSEAVTALHSILGKRIPENYCIKVANALMYSRPGLFEPVHYSQRSLITGTVYNSPDEIYTFDEDAGPNDIPRGVFTPLTKCYSYNCDSQQGGCYSPQCPNKTQVFEMEFSTGPDLSRQSSFRSNATTLTTNTSYPRVSWAERTSPELLKTISKREQERQEAINELIYSEEVYRNDLDTLHELVVIPLLEHNIIDGEKRKRFVKDVFNNYYELRDISTALFKDFLELQRRYDQKCLPMIGDIMLQHIPFFEKPFITYCPQVPLAEYIVDVESKANPELARFLEEVVNNQRMRRLAVRHFLLNPVTRVQRYKLLLSAVLKKTDQDHVDYAYLNRCIEMIGQVAAKADSQTAITEMRVEILKIDGSLTFKQGEFYDIQLTDAQLRKLYHRGELNRKPINVDTSEKSDIHAFVFDHMMLMTKYRKTTAGDEYRVWKRPIPLQLLFVEGAADFAGGGGLTGRVPSLGGSTAGGMVGSGGSANVKGAIPLTLHHLGQYGGIYTFFCSTLDEKQQWVDAIDNAKVARKLRHGCDQVFDLYALDDSSFRFISTAAASSGQGKVTCSVPFVSVDGEFKVAIGTDAGVYFKTVNQNNLRRVINCENVSQLAVMYQHHILLVLADRTLRAYPIDDLNSPTNITSPERLAQEIAQHVSSFYIGSCNNKHLLVYKKKKNTTSTFTALEPVCDLRDSRNPKSIQRRTFFLGQRSSSSPSSWFRKYRDFYVGADATNLHFLKTKLNVVCERGFEIIDPENLSVARDIPDEEDPQFHFVHRHSEPLKPLAMYRIHDKFLLCYNKFAFYVNNRNGTLVMNGSGRSPLLCEWEGNPDHIVYQHPYIVAISSQFIEVRHVGTGELVQIIPGNNIRMTYYNDDTSSSMIHVCMTHGQKPDTQLVYTLRLMVEN